jgi:hypothetical protein
MREARIADFIFPPIDVTHAVKTRLGGAVMGERYVAKILRIDPELPWSKCPTKRITAPCIRMNQCESYSQSAKNSRSSLWHFIKRFPAATSSSLEKLGSFRAPGFRAHAQATQTANLEGIPKTV